MIENYRFSFTTGGPSVAAMTIDLTPRVATVEPVSKIHRRARV